MRTYLIALLALAAGCRPASSAERESRGTLVGHVFYRDAQTDPEGTHHDADAPAEQLRGTLRMTVRGTGTIEARCLDASAGIFIAYYNGDLRIDGDGSYQAPLYPLTPAIYTPSGCAVDELTVAAITNVLIHAAVRANPERCRAMCAASARARGEAECAEAADRDDCRRTFERTAAEECEARCVGRATALGGDGALDNNALPDVDAANLRDGALGELSATIVFDHELDDQLQAIP
jgi:hypothetical protein